VSRKLASLEWTRKREGWSVQQLIGCGGDQGNKACGEAFEFGPRDTFVVPSWMPLELAADAECVLFSFSDRPAQDALGLWREKRE